MKSVFGGRLSLVVTFVAVLLSATFTLAQGIVTGSISGVVQDQQGAVVPNANVTVTHLATNRVFTTQTTSAGIIALRDLPTGAYNLKIEAANFRVYESKKLTVSVGKDTGLGTVQLLLGTSTESVTVEGTAPLIESTTDQISETFSTEKVASLPMGNTFDSLALFLPGVVTVGDASFSNNNGAEMSVNGLRARANNFQIDGQSNNDNSIAGPSIFFGNQDAISEMQVVTNYDAAVRPQHRRRHQLRHQVGTNQFHGTAYEFWQGSTFDSLENNEKNPLLGFCLPGSDGRGWLHRAQGSRLCGQSFRRNRGRPDQERPRYGFSARPILSGSASRARPLRPPEDWYPLQTAMLNWQRRSLPAPSV